MKFHLTRRLLAALACTLLVLSTAHPVAAEQNVVEGWDMKFTESFPYDTASSLLFADDVKLTKHAKEMAKFYNDNSAVSIGFWFYGYTDARCDPEAAWVKKLGLKNPCKLKNGVTPANRDLSEQRATALKTAVFSKLSTKNREKYEEYVSIIGAGEEYALVSKADCYADPASCAKDRYADALFMLRTAKKNPSAPTLPSIPPQRVAAAADAVTAAQGTSSVNVQTAMNDVCDNATCAAAVTSAGSSSPWVVPIAVNGDSSVDVWIHPLFEGSATFQYALLFFNTASQTIDLSAPATVTVNVTPGSPPATPAANPSISLRDTLWARLNTNEALTPTPKISCNGGVTVSASRCEAWSGNRAAAVTIVGVENANSTVTPPAGYPTNRFSRVQNAPNAPAGTTTYRFSQATPAGSYFSHEVNVEVVLRTTSERMNPDGSITVISSSDQRIPVSATSRIGVVGATG